MVEIKNTINKTDAVVNKDHKNNDDSDNEDENEKNMDG